MSHKDSSVVVNNTNLLLDEDGTLGLYFSSSLAEPDNHDQVAMYTWAELAVDPTRVDEASVSIVLDLPEMVKELLGNDFGHENVIGGFTVDPAHEPALGKVKEQLEEALALFRRVTYTTGEVTAEINPDDCHVAVYEHGESIGLFDYNKEQATAFCAEQTRLTGRLHDYHFVGGRAHVKALPRSWKHD